jgi:hypothetical protein
LVPTNQTQNSNAQMIVVIRQAVNVRTARV